MCEHFHVSSPSFSLLIIWIWISRHSTSFSFLLLCLHFCRRSSRQVVLYWLCFSFCAQLVSRCAFLSSFMRPHSCFIVAISSLLCLLIINFEKVLSYHLFWINCLRLFSYFSPSLPISFPPSIPSYFSLPHPSLAPSLSFELLYSRFSVLKSVLLHLIDIHREAFNDWLEVFCISVWLAGHWTSL